MNENDLLLTDEYFAFTETVRNLRNRKKELETEYKEFMESMTLRKTELKNELNEAAETWESFKTTKLNKGEPRGGA
jgi:cell division septum initiation protein DivIVA